MKEKIKTQKGFIQIPLLIAIIISIVIATGVGYGAIEYNKTSKIIKEAKQLSQEEKYEEAIKKLESAQNKLLGKIILKQKINTELDTNKKLFEDKIEYTQGIEEFYKGNFENAKELLLKVSEDFPHYQEAKNKIEEAERKIAEAKKAVKATCQDECSPIGLKRCSNNGYQTCGNYDEDNCLEWSSITNCPSNNVCQNGECVSAPIVQCNSGPCCDISTKKFKPSTYKCQENVKTEYGCPWGSSTGSDVGIRYQHRYCSGSSANCDGVLKWEDWIIYKDCALNEVCFNGVCKLLTCSDGTPYGQCSIDKPKYCENGNLINKCSLCNCPSGQFCQKNEDCIPLVDCEYKNYKMVFIVVEDSNNPATQEILSLLNEVKQKVSEMFTWATKNLASMDTSYPIVVLTLEDNPSIKDIMKEFYKKYPDNFHFITIFPTHDYLPEEAGCTTCLPFHFHLTVRNYIKGIGLGIYNSTGEYGSGGKLMGINWQTIELTLKYRKELEQVIDVKTDIANGILHETTHQWAAYVHFIDENGKRNNSLIYPFGSGHWSKKLDTGYDYLGGFSWIDNGDGTFTAKPTPDRQGYSNLTLYLMGLISKSEVGPIKLIISDRDETPIQPGDTIPGILKTISIQQIIDAEGERECVLP